jgi:DNA-binding transcriptional MocR family regulator
MRKVYEQRRIALMEAFGQHFGERAAISGSESGMHVLVNLADMRDADAFVKQAREFAGAATKVHDAAAGDRSDHREQVEEGLGAFVAEALVLGGVPGAGQGAPPFRAMGGG